MVTQVLPTLQDFTTITDKSIGETISTFFQCPYGFHGDTGLQHFLYHRLFTNAGPKIFWPPSSPTGKSTLLLQSEHYTKGIYIRTGMKESPGRMDLAIIDPTDININEKMPRAAGKKALIGIEVGKNKDIHKLGNFEVVSQEGGRTSGDAAKIINELRRGFLQVGYILEFFDGRSRSHLDDSESISNRLAKFVDELSDERLRVVIAVFRLSSEPIVRLFPARWGGSLGLPYKSEVIVQTGDGSDFPHKNRISYHDFIERCDDSGKELQKMLKERFDSPLKLLYGDRTMTVNLRPQGRLMRIGNARDKHGECVYEIDGSIKEKLYRRVPNLFYGDMIYTPQTSYMLAALTAALVDALSDVSSIRPHTANGLNGLQRKSNNRIPYGAFLNTCGLCGAALQEALHNNFAASLTLLYGGKTMTVNYGARGRIMRIGNRFDRGGEVIYEFNPRFANILQDKARTFLRGGLIPLPQVVNNEFIDSIVAAIIEFTTPL